MDIKQELLSVVRGPFFKSVAILASGTAFAQIINLLFVPIITRIYGPEAFGGLGYYSSLLTFLTPLSMLCYPLALVLPKIKSEAFILFNVSFTLAIIATLIIAVAIMFVDFYEVVRFPFEASCLLVPIGVFISAIVALYTQFCVRMERFRLLSMSLMLVAVVGGISKLVLGAYLPNAESLIKATVGTLFLHSLLLVVGVKQYPNFLNLIRTNKRQIYTLKKYIRFPVFRLPHTLIAVLNQILPIILLTTIFDTKTAGYYVLARTVLSVPVTLVGKAIFDVTYPKINNRFINGIDNYHFVRKMTLSLALVAIIPFIVVTVEGEWLFTTIFGYEWGRAGIYAGWLAIWYAFNLTNKPCAATISVYSLDKFLFKNGVFNVIMGTVGFVAGYATWNSDVMAIAMFSLFSVIAQISLITKVLVSLKARES